MRAPDGDGRDDDGGAEREEEETAGRAVLQRPEATWRGIVGKVRAGRSLKPAQWQGGARVAVALSFDSDHESVTLRDGEKSPGKLSQGQYGNRQGVPRVLALLESTASPRPSSSPPSSPRSTPTSSAGWSPPATRSASMAGSTSATGPALPAERDLQKRAADLLERVSGVRPVGIRTPSWDFSPHTLAISREMGLLYDCSLMADDDPYELLEDGQATGMVELPPEWIRDDAIYFNMDRFSALRPYTPPSAVLEIFTAEFDGAYREGGLFVLTMHPHNIGHRSRIALLERLIEHIRGHAGVWFATHADVARYVKAEAGL